MNKATQLTMLLFLSASLVACSSKPVEPSPEDTDYIVTFLNYDDTVLCQTKVRGGTYAKYLGDDPSKEPTDSQYFVFSGWDYNLHNPVYSNLVIRPLFSAKVRNYIATFVDWDDKVIKTVNVEYGSYATFYSINNPKRESDDEHFEYTFNGWDKEPSLTAIYTDTVFKATYVKTEYVLGRFLNYDGTLLSSTKTEKGSNFVYNGKTPTRPQDSDRIAYAFSTWDKSLNNVTVDTDFVAKFRTIEYVYATFYNYDGSRLSSLKVEKGKTPSYAGSTPTRTSTTSNMKYKFKGWDKSITSIYEDTSYTAVFDLINIWTVTFKNWDGTTLQTKEVDDGGTVVYTGSTPYRASTTSGDYQYRYSFSGWSGSLSNIRSNTTLTAQFNSTYTVTGQTAIKQHLNNNGTGSYHNVYTFNSGSAFATLGYSGSYYYMGYTNSSSMTSTIALNCAYGDSYAVGVYQIKDGSTVMFQANYTVYFSYHQYSSITCTKVTTNRYTTDDQLTAVAAMTILAAKFASNYASEYLVDNDLPYIF